MLLVILACYFIIAIARLTANDIYFLRVVLVLIEHSTSIFMMQIKVLVSCIDCHDVVDDIFKIESELIDTYG